MVPFAQQAGGNLLSALYSGFRDSIAHAKRAKTEKPWISIGAIAHSGLRCTLVDIACYFCWTIILIIHTGDNASRLILAGTHLLYFHPFLLWKQIQKKHNYESHLNHQKIIQVVLLSLIKFTKIQHYLSTSVLNAVGHAMSLHSILSKWNIYIYEYTGERWPACTNYPLNKRKMGFAMGTGTRSTRTYLK